MQPNEAMKAMARRICAQCAGDAGTINHPIAPRFLAGELDDHPAMRSALAAIMETQRLDAELAERVVSPDWPHAVPALASRRDLATAIRSGEHYAPPSHPGER